MRAMYFQTISPNKVAIHLGCNCQYLVGYFHKYSSGWMVQINRVDHLFTDEDMQAIVNKQKLLNSQL